MSTHSAASPFRFIFLIASLIATALLVGCGGGGSSKKRDFAPGSLNGRTITIQDAVLASTTAYIYTGTVSGTFTSPLPAGNGDNGTFVYTKTVGTTTQAVLQMTGISAVATTYNLTFTSASGGNYTDNLSNSSSFTIN